MNISIPSNSEAEALLDWAHNLNPGPWAEHCRVAAKAAATIAQAVGLDQDRAYVSGLLHDIGRYEGVRGLHHVYAGYDLLTQKGYPILAEICLSHSFTYQDLRAYSGGDYDCTPEEIAVITGYLEKAQYNEYDKLIQLCDCLGSVEGVCLIEKRLVNVVRRHGTNDFTIRKWDAYFELKDYFDGLLQGNIYDLFYDEIRIATFERG